MILCCKFKLKETRQCLVIIPTLLAQNLRLLFVCNTRYLWADNRRALWKMEDFTRFIKYFLDVTYFTGVGLFRLSLQKAESGKSLYVAKQWWPQFSVEFKHFSARCCWLHEFRLTLPGRTNIATKHFSFASNIIMTVMKLIAIKNLWFNKQKFLDLANFLLNGSNLPSGKTKLTSKLFAGIVTALYTGMAIGSCISGSGAFHVTGTGKLAHWTPARWWSHMMDTGWTNFFMGTERLSTTSVQIQNQRSPGLDILGIFGLMGFVQRFVGKMFVNAS